MYTNHFQEHVGYFSILPVLISILGIYSIYLTINEYISQAMIVMMIGFVVYILNNLILNKYDYYSMFNEFLEDMGVYILFVVPTIIFGFHLFGSNTLFLLLVLFYGITMIFSLARNWILPEKNSQGWPTPLNGLFFPVVYFFGIFYLPDFYSALFIIYYILVPLLSMSHYNFLRNKNNSSIN